MSLHEPQEPDYPFWLLVVALLLMAWSMVAGGRNV